MITIKDRLKQLRKEKGLTQQQVADAINVDRVSYTRYENGSRTPTNDSVIALAKLYGCTTDYLFGAEDVTNNVANNIIKDRIATLRKEYYLTQKELGQRIGVQDSAISKYERGEVSPPTDILIKLSDVLKCTTDYLLGRTDDPRAVLWTDVPQEMKDAGIDAVELLQEALDKGFTKKDIKKMINMFYEWKKVDEEE